MRFSTFAVAVAAAGSASAQANATVCDKYTSVLFQNNNTAANQFTLIALLVKTAVIGNFTGNGTANPTLPGSMNAVPGIINPAGGILKYFDGSLKSTNRGGKAVAMNFLDGQSNTSMLTSEPLFIGSAGSNQATLFTHLVEYFGSLLGCSGYGTASFPAYMGSNSQYNVHKYMDLSETEHTYFIQQVGLAATSFGVTMADVNGVAMTLNSTFGYRCAPAAMVIPGSQSYQQVICQGTGCPLASSTQSGCSGMAAVAGYTPTMAALASGTGSASSGSMTGSMTGSATGSMTGTAAMTTGTGAAAAASSAAGSAASSGASAATGAAPRQTAAAGLLAGVAGVAAMLI